MHVWSKHLIPTDNTHVDMMCKDNDGQEHSPCIAHAEELANAPLHDHGGLVWLNVMENQMAALCTKGRWREAPQGWVRRGWRGTPG